MIVVEIDDANDNGDDDGGDEKGEMISGDGDEDNDEMVILKVLITYCII